MKTLLSHSISRRLHSKLLVAEGTVSQVPRRSLIGAVVVSHNPQEDFVRNVRAVASQSDFVIVVDNASGKESMPCVTEVAALPGVRILYNRENMGIATALNQGVRALRERGADWILTLDQDSLVCPGYVDAFTHGILKMQRQGISVHVVTPLLKEAAFTHDVAPSKLDRISIEQVDNAITSGAMYRADIFELLGFFRDDFFIDMVDHEFHLRIIRTGGSIYRFNHVPLIHSMGRARTYNVAGLSVLSRNWSPMRRYFSARNRVLVYREYLAVFPMWCAKDMGILLRNVVTLLLCESDKRRKLISIALGLRDGFLRDPSDQISIPRRAE